MKSIRLVYFNFKLENVINDYFVKGIEACTSALTIAPDHAEVHKWYAVLIGKSNFPCSVRFSLQNN